MICECGLNHKNAKQPIYCRCGRILGKRPVPNYVVATGPVPRARWPMWVVTIAVFAVSTDTGVGDTFHRLAEKFGGEWVIRKLGINCGCEYRRDLWNASYPYDRSEA